MAEQIFIRDTFLSRQTHAHPHTYTYTHAHAQHNEIEFVKHTKS